MKKCLLIVFLLSFHFLHAHDFRKIATFAESPFNEKRFRETINEQQELYRQSGDKYHLLSARFIEAFLYGNLNDNNRRILKLLWVSENCDESHYEIYVSACYHLSSYLVYCNSYETADGFAETALQTAKKHKMKGIMPLLYTLKGTISYNLKDYRKAIRYYKNSLKHHSNYQDRLFIASMNNNISLCYMQSGNYPRSNEYIGRSLKHLEQIPDKNSGEAFFEALVKGNLGSNYYRMGAYEKAKPLLNGEIDFYFTHPDFLENALHPVQELLSIYQKEGNTQKTAEILARIPRIEQSIKNVKSRNEFTKILYDHYYAANDLANTRLFGQKLIRNNQLIFDSIIRNSNALNNMLYKQQIRHLKKQFKTRDKLFQTTLESKQKSNTFMLLLISSVTVILMILFIERNRREKRNKVIQAQEQLIETKKRIILENEVKLKQEKITNMALNLNLKKETENAFLQKIKEIKRRKNSDPETILKELQLSVTNLINIDQKNAGNSFEVEEENSRFMLELQKLHPGLSKQEISFCSYFRMNLNSKEIASITNMTSGTIRVYKNKIKAKVGLQSEESLNDYLQAL